MKTQHFNGAGARRRRAFTILELMIALTIFSMVITAIYSTWTAILRASRAGLDAAADMQRSRIAARTLEEALATAVMFQANQPLYTFEADTSGQFSALSFVARLPASFLGGGYFGDLHVRRLTFSVEAAPEGGSQLVLTQIPLLQTNAVVEQEHTVVLARDVTMFALEFYDQREGWLTEWDLTNRLPRLVRFAMAFGKEGGRQTSRSTTVRTVDIPSTIVARQWQVGSAAPNPGLPGAGGTNRPTGQGGASSDGGSFQSGGGLGITPGLRPGIGSGGPP